MVQTHGTEPLGSRAGPSGKRNCVQNLERINLMLKIAEVGKLRKAEKELETRKRSGPPPRMTTPSDPMKRANERERRPLAL